MKGTMQECGSRHRWLSVDCGFSGDCWCRDGAAETVGAVETVVAGEVQQRLKGQQSLRLWVL